MIKFVQLNLMVLLLLLWENGNSQQPLLTVQSFEYIWQRDFAAMSASGAPRIIIALDDSVKLLMKNSFARALKNRWNIVLPEISFSVKPLPFLANRPKFKTSLKEKDPGKWHLFLQLYDKGDYLDQTADRDTFATTLELKCRLVNGANDSIILDRALTVNIYKEPAPPDQVLLKRVPAFPASFIVGFDSIAIWLFQSEPVAQRSLRLKPACLFQQTAIKESPLAELHFKTNTSGIDHITSPVFYFNRSWPKYEKMDTRRNTGGNAAGGVFTLLTGIHSGKSRSFEHKADFEFKESDTVYHCLINYVEEETAERQREKRVEDNGTKIFSMKSTDYTFLRRYIDSAFLNVVTIGEDTLATFRVQYAATAGSPQNYTQMWDGSDTATVGSLPPEWRNTEMEADLIISGKMEGNSFLMKTSKETRVKEFFLNDKLATIIQGNEKPAKGFVFRPVSPRQLKLFTILSSLPYSYFNKSLLN